MAFGRFPYSGSRLTAEDNEMIDKAIAYMELQEFEDRFIDELSGEGGDFEGINAYLPRTYNENDEVFSYTEEIRKVIADLWSRV